MNRRACIRQDTFLSGTILIASKMIVSITYKVGKGNKITESEKTNNSTPHDTVRNQKKAQRHHAIETYDIVSIYLNHQTY